MRFGFSVGNEQGGGIQTSRIVTGEGGEGIWLKQERLISQKRAQVEQHTIEICYDNCSPEKGSPLECF